MEGRLALDIWGGVSAFFSTCRVRVVRQVPVDG
jgi:hypothetical protein